MNKTSIFTSLFVALAFIAFGAPSVHAEVVRERGNGVVWYINRADGHRYQLSMNAGKMFDQVKSFAIPVTNDVLFSDSLKDPMIRSNNPKTCKLAKSVDTDQDCIDNAFETALYASSLTKDTDGDGYSDFTELMTGHSLTRTPAQEKLGPRWYKNIPSLESRLDGAFILETQNKNQLWYVKRVGNSNLRIFVNSPSLVRSQVYLTSKFVTRAEVSKFPVGKWPTKDQVTSNRSTLLYPQTIDSTLGYQDAKMPLLIEAQNIKNR